ncbi:hypothetical protein [Palleronia aestuarii]|uniref:hypothetical protein n=1 Tax=Palleronia aestuarii TaxID=568105 RepID=UPI00147307CB|nr:hypothetical protein [Palleronia aestuarii]
MAIRPASIPFRQGRGCPPISARASPPPGSSFAVALADQAFAIDICVVLPDYFHAV